MNTRSICPTLLLCTSALLLSTPTQAATLPQNGLLLGADDTPHSGATVLSFRLYPSAVGGAVAWDSGPCNVNVQQGRYSVVLGQDCGGSIPDAALPDAAPRYLEAQIGASLILAPRLILGAVPAAQRSATSADAQQLIQRLQTAGMVNTGSNPVDWSQLKNVPAGLADGTDDGNTYDAGAGLTLTNGRFSLTSDRASLATVSGGQLSVDATGTLRAPAVASTGPVSGTQLSASSATVTGAVTAGSFAGGSVSGSSATFSGAVSAGSLGATSASVTGGVSAGTITAGSYEGTSATLSGALTAGALLGSSATVSGTITAGSFVGNGAGLTNVDAAKVGGKSLADLQQMFAASSGGSSVAVGDDSGTCDATRAGRIRYRNGNFEGCDGSLWTGFQGKLYQSCAEAYDAGVRPAELRIDPDSSGPLSPITVRCDMTGDGGGWTEFAAWDGTVEATGAMYTSGSGTPLSANYVYACNTWGTLDLGAAVMRVKMGSVTDFFTPASGETLCTMLPSFTKHLWSASPTGFFERPSYYTSHLGGSANQSTPPYGMDGRNYLSFWGGGGGTAGGGCCYTSSNLQGGSVGTGAWGRAMTASFRVRPDKVGAKRGNPGASCKAILNAGASTGDGIYWVDPNGGSNSDAFQVYCDMTSHGGGWTLLALEFSYSNWTLPPNQSETGRSIENLHLKGIPGTNEAYVLQVMGSPFSFTEMWTGKLTSADLSAKDATTQLRFTLPAGQTWPPNAKLNASNTQSNTWCTAWWYGTSTDKFEWWMNEASGCGAYSVGNSGRTPRRIYKNNAQLPWNGSGDTGTETANNFGYVLAR